MIHRWGTSTIVSMNAAQTTSRNDDASVKIPYRSDSSSTSGGYMGVVEVSQDAATKRLNAIANDVRHLNTALHTALFTSR
jgi:hypothetical protein